MIRALVLVASSGCLDPTHLALKAKTQLMNQLMVGGTKRDQILGIVGPSSSDALKMVDVQPTLIRATVAMSIDKGATPAIAGIDGVEFARREGLALAGYRFSRTRARFCTHEF